jgi:hypothetical protein
LHDVGYDGVIHICLFFRPLHAEQPRRYDDRQYFEEYTLFPWGWGVLDAAH